MTEPKNPVERAVELFFYAPVGLAVAARDLVPVLVERGRRQVDPQVGVAHAIGQLAVAQGRAQAEKALERALTSASATLQQLGVLPSEAPSAEEEAGPGATAPGPVAKAESPPPVRHRDGPSAVDLAIPDYDSLSASQVVPRLSSLTESELAAVRIYETEHRGRKTILSKIAQLRVP